MVRLLVYFILFASLALNVYLLLPIKNIPPPTSQNKPVSTASRIIDGDTFDTSAGERIRLYEINAPEYPAGCMGEDAKERLEELILNSNVSLETFGKDNFGRTLAYVYHNGLFMNEILVEEGLAYYEKGKASASRFLDIEKAQEKAKLALRGVWSSLCQTKKQGCLIKGNYREADHTRIYHTPDCYNYEKITIRPGTSDRWFCSEEEAIGAGFRKSLDCPK